MVEAFRRARALQTFPAIVRKRYAAGEQATRRVTLSDGEHLLVYGTAQLTQGRIFAFTVHESPLGTLAGCRSIF